MRANAVMGKWWESSKIFSKNEWLQHLLCSKPRVWISFHRIKHFNYSMWWEWRWCITSSIHLIWYHFLYRLEHLLSIIFQVLAGSRFFLVGVLCLAFADIYWSTCISQANKQTIEKKKPMRNSIKLRHKFIHRRMNHRAASFSVACFILNT